MQGRLVVGILLVGMLLGGASALALKTSSAPPATAPAIKPTLEAFVVDAPPADPSFAGPPGPPHALPPLSADAPPMSAPVGGLPPLPVLGDGAIMPSLANIEPNDASRPAVAAPPPPQDLSPPRGHTKIEQRIRQISGVSSLAWGEGKTLHILVRNVSPAAIAKSACGRANAVTSGVRVHVQSVSSPQSPQSQRSC